MSQPVLWETSSKNDPEIKRIDKNGRAVARAIVPTGATIGWDDDYATVPEGWLRCDGTLQLVSRYPRLYDEIGNANGGERGTSFVLPSTANTIIKT